MSAVKNSTVGEPASDISSSLSSIGDTPGSSSSPVVSKSIAAQTVGSEPVEEPVASPQATVRRSGRTRTASVKTKPEAPVVQPSPKRKRVASRTIPKKLRFDAETIFTHAKSPLRTADLRNLLLSTSKAWDLLNTEEKAEVLALFPDQYHVVPAGDGQEARPDLRALMSDDTFRSDCASYISYVNQGYLTPDWIESAWSAHEGRKVGEFDEYLDRKFERDWEVTIPEAFKTKRQTIVAHTHTGRNGGKAGNLENEPEPDGGNLVVSEAEEFACKQQGGFDKPNGETTGDNVNPETAEVKEKTLDNVEEIQSMGLESGKRQAAEDDRNGSGHLGNTDQATETREVKRDHEKDGLDPFVRQFTKDERSDTPKTYNSAEDDEPILQRSKNRVTTSSKPDTGSPLMAFHVPSIEADTMTEGSTASIKTSDELFTPAESRTETRSSSRTVKRHSMKMEIDAAESEDELAG